MKKWNAPEIDELNVSCTENGKDISKQFDEIRVDQNGNYWASFASGIDSKPDTDGEVKVL